MKKNTLLLLVFIFSIATFQAQDINFSFNNAVNTNDGTNDFYEVDVLIESTVDFKLGSGLLYFNYNTAAFGTNISSGGKVNFSYDPTAGYICGEKDSTVGSIDVYGSYVQNDNTASRFTFTFSQTFGSGSIGANNVSNVATKLFHLKIQYLDVTQDPDICFEFAGVYIDQFYTACGPTSPLTAVDCTGVPGAQLLNDTYDCSGAVVATLGVVNVKPQLEFSLYPNPTTNAFYIKGLDKGYKLSMYSISGALVLEQNNYKGEGIQIKKLPTGMYFVKVTNAQEEVVLKLIKE